MSQLEDWLNSIPAHELVDIRPASADASFRRYFRVTDRNTKKTFIVMDAPPDKEDCAPFIHITQLLRSVNVNAPDIITMDLDQGFLLLDDLGVKPYLDVLNEDNAEDLYRDAIAALVRMQSIDAILPAYSKKQLQTELELFESWYVNIHLGIELTAGQQQSLDHPLHRGGPSVGSRGDY